MTISNIPAGVFSALTSLFELYQCLEVLFVVTVIYAERFMKMTSRQCRAGHLSDNLRSTLFRLLVTASLTWIQIASLLLHRSKHCIENKVLLFALLTM